MARLPKKTAERVNAAESQDFSALPAGKYLAQLRDVDTTKEGAKGPYWSWEFEVIEGDHTNRRLWVNTSLSENADWKMKEVFNGLGHDATSDTDDMIGEKCWLVVSERIIEQGARAGQKGNNVDQVLVYDGTAAAESDEDNMFD